MSKIINQEKPWSMSDDKTLLKLYEEQKSSESIAKTLGRSEKSVTDRIKSIFENIDFSVSDENTNLPWSKEDDDRLIYLYDRKIDINSISKDLMRSEIDIFRRLLGKKHADNEFGEHILPMNEQKDLMSLYKDGMTIQDLAGYFKKSEKSILSMIYQMLSGGDTFDGWTKEEEKEMFTLFFSRFKLNDISKSLKKPKHDILKHMRELCQEMQDKFSYDDKKILELTGFDLSRGQKTRRNADE